MKSSLQIIATLVVSACFSSCSDSSGTRSKDKASTAAGLFVDVTKDVGLDFEHEVDLEGAFKLPEIMGSGLAVFDADGDGRLDLYFLNAGKTLGEGAANRLFLRTAEGSYREAEQANGLNDSGYGMGAAVGDVDNDGDLDVFVGNWGPDRLYLNDGQGRFEDSGQAFNNSWTSSIAMIDYDLDGLLDVYATHYVKPDLDRECTLAAGRRDFCSPKVFPGVRDALYRNLGGGNFEDVSETTGIAAAALNGLGVRVHDFNDDGRPDIFVANDGEVNLLWQNVNGKRFVDVAIRMGLAVNGRGNAEASMGIALGDVDLDGDLDLLATHLKNESHTLYLCDEDGYTDATGKAGMHTGSLADTGFGTAFFDADGDGDQDLAVANGRVGWSAPIRGDQGQGALLGYGEPNRLFLNNGEGRFVLADTEAGTFASPVEISRGLAAVDLDGDGDVDLVVTNTKGPARVYDNRGTSGHWLAVDARLPDLNRRALGAIVTVKLEKRILKATVGSDTSYQTSVDAPLLFSLGQATSVEHITVRWPGGELEKFTVSGIDQQLVLDAGQGERP